MLNDLATSYASLPDETVRVLHFGIFALAGLLGAISRNSKLSITRAQYFVSLSLLAFANAVSGIGTLFTLPAIEHNLYWLATGYPLIVITLTGFILGRASVARAIDIGGQKQLAILGFIPLANLYLLLKGGRNRPGFLRPGTTPFLSGGKGVAVGLMIFALGIYTSVNIKTTLITENYQKQLSAQLGRIADELQPMLPITTGETVDLVMVKAAQNELQRTYIVYEPGFEFTSDAHEQIAAYLCNDPKIEILVKAGAVFVENYVTDHEHLNTFRISQTDCGQ